MKEQGDDIVFLRKIVPGDANKSYGIQVARLAGVPEPVISRAKELLKELSDADITEKVQESAAVPKETVKVRKPDDVDRTQMTLFDTVRDEDIIAQLKAVDIPNLTPLEAMNVLYDLQSKLKNRWSNPG